MGDSIRPGPADIFLRSAGNHFDKFHKDGMRISPSKSAILLDARGNEARSMLSKAVSHSQGKKQLAYTQQGESVCIPVRKSHGYLGTIISYRAGNQLHSLCSIA